MGSCELVKDLQEAPLRVMQRETVSDHLRCGSGGCLVPTSESLSLRAEELKTDCA